MNTALNKRIQSLGLVLPPAPKPMGVYRPLLVEGNYIYVSGQGPLLNDNSLIIGKVGSDFDQEEGKNAARQVGLTMLSTLVTHLDASLRIKRVIKVLGMVNATPSFKAHPYVINGFSELMVEVFGEEFGIGARSAVGMTLPQNIPVEIEAQFLLDQ